MAVALADRLRRRGHDPVAISADALQVYRGLEILTGAPTAEERRRLEHRLVGFVPLTRAYSVGEYMPVAHAEVDAATAAGRRPIVVGGTGLYLRAALTTLALAPPPPPELRERLGRDAEDRGVAALHSDLRRRAPEVAGRVDPSDRTRVIRALELLEQGVAAPRAGESQLWSGETRVPTRLFTLAIDRSELYRRIERRVEEMAAAGVVDEVKRAAADGPSPTARKALGFDEFLAGDLGAVKRRTRNYAKRQLTWMRKLPEAVSIDVTGREAAEVAADIEERLTSEAG